MNDQETLGLARETLALVRSDLAHADPLNPAQELLLAQAALAHRGLPVHAVSTKMGISDDAGTPLNFPVYLLIVQLSEESVVMGLSGAIETELMKGLVEDWERHHQTRFTGLPRLGTSMVGLNPQAHAEGLPEDYFATRAGKLLANAQAQGLDEGTTASPSAPRSSARL